MFKELFTQVLVPIFCGGVLHCNAFLLDGTVYLERCVPFEAQMIGYSLWFRDALPTQVEVSRYELIFQNPPVKVVVSMPKEYCYAL